MLILLPVDEMSVLVNGQTNVLALFVVLSSMGPLGPLCSAFDADIVNWYFVQGLSPLIVNSHLLPFTLCISLLQYIVKYSTPVSQAIQLLSCGTYRINHISIRLNSQLSRSWMRHNFNRFQGEI